MGSLSVPTAVAMGLVAMLTTFTGCGHEKESGAAADVTPPPTATPSTRPAPSPSAVPSDLDPDLVRVGTAFLRFARDEPDATLPVDTPVGVIWGGAPSGSIAAADAQDRRPWSDLCGADGDGYAERPCPLSTLTPLSGPGQVTVTTEPAQEPCSRPHGIEPSDVGASRRVTLLARPHGSCLDYAAVELYVNDVSQLVAVNLVLGSP